MQLSEIRQVHDLLQVNPGALNLTPAAPAWVNEALKECPWVVVRRAEAPSDHVAVGVRGSNRSERWASTVAKNSVSRIVQPAELLQDIRDSNRILRTPALKALHKLIERWRELDLAWGPVGSVGFELATKCQVTSERSDVDIAIRAPQRISVQEAQQLWNCTIGLEAKVDARVETPECGFSLEEYARSSAPILLHYPDTVRLGDNPWSASTKPAATAV
jgi:phosphoribosyl-dephospho-CoA transferase